MLHDLLRPIYLADGDPANWSRWRVKSDDISG